MSSADERAANLGVCGKCGALPRERCRDARGKKTWEHADRFVIGQRREKRPL